MSNERLRKRNNYLSCSRMYDIQVDRSYSSDFTAAKAADARWCGQYRRRQFHVDRLSISTSGHCVDYSATDCVTVASETTQVTSLSFPVWTFASGRFNVILLKVHCISEQVSAIIDIEIDEMAYFAPPWNRNPWKGSKNCL